MNRDTSKTWPIAAGCPPPQTERFVLDPAILRTVNRANADKEAKTQ